MADTIPPIRKLSHAALVNLAIMPIMNPHPTAPHINAINQMTDIEKKVVARILVCAGSNNIEKQAALRWASLNLADERFVADLGEHLHDARLLLSVGRTPVQAQNMPKSPLLAFEYMKKVVGLHLTAHPALMPVISGHFLGNQIYTFYDRDTHYAAAKADGKHTLKLFLASQGGVCENAYLEHEKFISALIDEYFTFDAAKRVEVIKAVAALRAVKQVKAEGYIDKEPMLTLLGKAWLKVKIGGDETVLDSYLSMTHAKNYLLKGKGREIRLDQLVDLMIGVLDAQA